MVREFLDNELVPPLDGYIRHMKDFQLRSYRTMTVPLEHLLRARGDRSNTAAYALALYRRLSQRHC